MNFKIKTVIGLLVITAVLFVYRVFVHEMKKMPFNYEVISEHEGQDRILEAIGGTLSTDFSVPRFQQEWVLISRWYPVKVLCNQELASPHR